MNILSAENLYYIGGVVRDEILGKSSFDVDLTYVGNAIEYAKTVQGAEILRVNEPFGTVRILLNGQEIDIASTRSEIYEKAGHLPVVTKIGCSLKEDVLRRDFTINALAKNTKTSEIVDFTGGLKDIENKKLRVLHDKSFVDDPTRILRALKFSVRFGFELEANTKLLRDNYLKNINYDMSYKRLKKELIETFNLNSQKAYDEFINAGIYKLVTPQNTVHPKIDIESLVNKYKKLIEPSYVWLIYAGTLADLSNLEPTFTREEQKVIDDYKQIEKIKPQSDFEIYKMFQNKRIETVLLYGILNDCEISEKYLDNLKNCSISLKGKDLQNLGIEPSKKYQACFDFILSKKLENPNITVKDELEFAKEFFKAT